MDEIFLSHADLDHFNGVPALIERFPVGRISLTPSFASKPSPGVHEVINAFVGSSVPVRIVMAGDELTAGELTLDVLHPPKEGPAGPENNRSMVLAVRHRGRTILLTGDLDGEGRTCLFNRRRELTDVLMAPHHGGKTANPRDLPDWCRPEGARGRWTAPMVCEKCTNRPGANIWARGRTGR
jgi:competence protein ComEC